MENKKRLDLIDRGALGIGYANPLAFDKIEYAHGWNSAISIIKNAPTVDAVEVKHGRWILREDGYHCSNCDIQAIYTGVKLNYCPNCGAKMDGDGNADV